MIILSFLSLSYLVMHILTASFYIINELDVFNFYLQYNLIDF